MMSYFRLTIESFEIEWYLAGTSKFEFNDSSA